MAIIETGRVTLSSTIDDSVTANVTFTESISNPVAVAYIPTRGGGQSINFRIRNLTSTGMEVFTEEPDNEGHASEDVVWMVVEEGEHTVDGINIEAHSHTTSSVRSDSDSSTFGDSISFNTSFSSSPVVLHSLNTYNNGQFMATQANSVTSTDFNLSQEAAETGNSGTTEDLGWIAIDSTSGSSDSIDGNTFETNIVDDGSSDGVDETPQSISFSASFGSAPDIIVSMQSMNGTDGAWARGEGTWSTTSHNTYAEEDEIVDTERGHANETFAYIAIEPDTLIIGETTAEDTPTLTDISTFIFQTASNGLLDAPTSLTATEDGVKIDLNWTINSGSETNTLIYRDIDSGSTTSDYTLIGGTKTGDSTYTDYGLNGGTTYYYRVTSIATQFENLSAEDATDSGATATGQSWNDSNWDNFNWTGSGPVDVIAEPDSESDGFEITWSPPSTTPDGYFIYRSATSGEQTIDDYSLVGAVPSGTTSFVDNGVIQINGPFYYRVSSFGIDVESNVSNEDSALAENPSATDSGTLTSISSQTFQDTETTSSLEDNIETQATVTVEQSAETALTLDSGLQTATVTAEQAIETTAALDDSVTTSQIVTPQTSTETSSAAEPASISRAFITPRPDQRFAEIGNTGQLSNNNAGITGAADSTTLNFQNTYDDPVVISHIPTLTGGQSIDDNVTNITASSADLFSIEPDLQGHNDEWHSYIVADKGVHTTPEGYRVEVGSITTSSEAIQGGSQTFDTVTFSESYDTAPVVLATINSHNSEDFKTVAIQNVTSSGFDVSKQRLSTNASATETIGWIAIPAGVTTRLGGRIVRTEVASSSSSTFSGFVNTPEVFTERRDHTDWGWARGVASSRDTTDWNETNHNYRIDGDNATPDSETGTTYSFIAIQPGNWDTVENVQTATGDDGGTLTASTVSIQDATGSLDTAKALTAINLETAGASVLTEGATTIAQEPGIITDMFSVSQAIDSETIGLDSPDTTPMSTSTFTSTDTSLSTGSDLGLYFGGIGSNDEVVVPHDSSLNVSGDLTIAMRGVFPSNIDVDRDFGDGDNTWRGVMEKSGEWDLFIEESGSFTFSVEQANEGGLRHFVGDGGLEYGQQWTVVGTYDSSTGNIEFFLNGNSLGVEDGVADTLNTGTGDFRIGNFGSADLRAVISHARIDAEKWDASEIAEYSSGGSPQTGNERLVLPLNEGSGTTVFDISGNNNDGTHNTEYVPFTPYASVEYIPSTDTSLSVDNASITSGSFTPQLIDADSIAGDSASIASGTFTPQTVTTSSSALDDGGTGLEFNGTDTRVALPKFYDTLGELSELTAAAWVYVPPGGGDLSVLDYDRSEYYTFAVGIPSDNFSSTGDYVGFHTRGESGGHDMWGNTNIRDGSVHHVAVVYDGTDKIIYVDGEEDARATNPHNGEGIGSSTTRYGFMGAGSEATSFDGGTNVQRFDGTIYDLKEYNIGLSASQISNLASGESVTTGLTSHWPLDEGTASTAFDVVGGFDGTIFNGTYVQEHVRINVSPFTPTSTSDVLAISGEAAWDRTDWNDSLWSDSQTADNSIANIIASPILTNADGIVNDGPIVTPLFTSVISADSIGSSTDGTITNAAFTVFGAQSTGFALEDNILQPFTATVQSPQVTGEALDIPVTTSISVTVSLIDAFTSSTDANVTDASFNTFQSDDTSLSQETPQRAQMSMFVFTPVETATSFDGASLASILSTILTVDADTSSLDAATLVSQILSVFAIDADTSSTDEDIVPVVSSQKPANASLEESTALVDVSLQASTTSVLTDNNDVSSASELSNNALMQVSPLTIDSDTSAVDDGVITDITVTPETATEDTSAAEDPIPMDIVGSPFGDETFAEIGEVFIAGNDAGITNAADSESISFTNTYDNPVAVGHMAGASGGQPVDDKITNLTSTGMDLFNIEPDLQTHNDNEHVYIVAEEGVHLTPQGHKIEAGVHTTNSTAVKDGSQTFDSVSFTESFDSAPIVLATVTTHNSNDFSTPAIKNVTSSGFDVSQQLTSTNAVATEDIGWIAIPNNVVTQFGGRVVETTTTTTTTGLSSTTFTNPFSQRPAVFPERQTHTNWGWARNNDSWTRFGNNYYIEGEDTVDTNTTFGHVAITRGDVIEVVDIDEGTAVDEATISQITATPKLAIDTALALDGATRAQIAESILQATDSADAFTDGVQPATATVLTINAFTDVNDTGLSSATISTQSDEQSSANGVTPLALNWESGGWNDKVWGGGPNAGEGIAAGLYSPLSIDAETIGLASGLQNTVVTPQTPVTTGAAVEEGTLTSIIVSPETAIDNSITLEEGTITSAVVTPEAAVDTAITFEEGVLSSIVATPETATEQASSVDDANTETIVASPETVDADTSVVDDAVVQSITISPVTADSAGVAIDDGTVTAATVTPETSVDSGAAVDTGLSFATVTPNSVNADTSVTTGLVETITVNTKDAIGSIDTAVALTAVNIEGAGASVITDDGVTTSAGEPGTITDMFATPETIDADTSSTDSFIQTAVITPRSVNADTSSTDSFIQSIVVTPSTVTAFTSQTDSGLQTATVTPVTVDADTSATDAFIQLINATPIVTNQSIVTESDIASLLVSTFTATDTGSATGGVIENGVVTPQTPIEDSDATDTSIVETITASPIDNPDLGEATDDASLANVTVDSIDDASSSSATDGTLTPITLDVIDDNSEGVDSDTPIIASMVASPSPASDIGIALDESNAALATVSITDATEFTSAVETPVLAQGTVTSLLADDFNAVIDEGIISVATITTTVSAATSVDARGLQDITVTPETPAESTDVLETPVVQSIIGTGVDATVETDRLDTPFLTNTRARRQKASDTGIAVVQDALTSAVITTFVDGSSIVFPNAAVAQSTVTPVTATDSVEANDAPDTASATVSTITATEQTEAVIDDAEADVVVSPITSTDVIEITSNTIDVETRSATASIIASADESTSVVDTPITAPATVSPQTAVTTSTVDDGGVVTTTVASSIGTQSEGSFTEAGGIQTTTTTPLAADSTGSSTDGIVASSTVSSITATDSGVALDSGTTPIQSTSRDATTSISDAGFTESMAVSPVSVDADTSALAGETTTATVTPRTSIENATGVDAGTATSAVVTTETADAFTEAFTKKAVRPPSNFTPVTIDPLTAAVDTPSLVFVEFSVLGDSTALADDSGVLSIEVTPVTGRIAENDAGVITQAVIDSLDTTFQQEERVGLLVDSKTGMVVSTEVSKESVLGAGVAPESTVRFDEITINLAELDVEFNRVTVADSRNEVLVGDDTQNETLITNESHNTIISGGEDSIDVSVESVNESGVSNKDNSADTNDGI